MKEEVKMKLTKSQIEEAVNNGKKALAENPSKKVALVYPDGFVPNSYRWPAPAQRVRVTDDGYSIESYDRKRSHGAGSYITLWNK